MLLQSNGRLHYVVVTLASLFQPPEGVKEIVDVVITDNGNALTLELSLEPTVYVVRDEDLAIEEDSFTQRVAHALWCLIKRSHCFVTDLEALVKLKCTDNLRARYGDRLVHNGE